MEPLKCLQINLHRAVAATALLKKRFLNDKFNIGFIQEPWTIGTFVKGLSAQSCKLIYSSGGQERPRAALLLNDQVTFFPLTEFITKDVVAAIIDIKTEKGYQKTVFASAYFDDKLGIPPSDLVKLMDYCKRANLHIVIGCDANAHHTCWGSSDINKRGEYLLDYLNSVNLVVVNVGNKPTYRHEGRDVESVIDLTITTPLLSSRIVNWHVSDEVSLSDHRHICFEVQSERTEEEYIRSPKMTDWQVFRQKLVLLLVGFQVIIYDSEDLDRVTAGLMGIIWSAYEQSCPILHRKAKRDVPWWNSTLQRLRDNLRRLFNRVRGSTDRTVYRETLTEYNKEVRKAKRKSWSNFCESVNATPVAARLKKVLCKEHSNGIGTLRKSDGSLTESREDTLELLLSTHFPGCRKRQTTPTNLTKFRRFDGIEMRSFVRSKQIFNEQRIRWAIRSFEPFKSPGEDGIFPALLQQGLEEILDPLVKIFRWSYTLGHIPEPWRGVKVVFIPKAGKREADLPKSYRPISLTSFLLKTMEKVIDFHIRNEILKRKPLRKEQHAYCQGKSTTTALHSLVRKVEKSIQSKEMALVAFLDIEGAFDNTGYLSITHAAERKGIGPDIVRWISGMLQSRVMTAQLGSDKMTIEAARGCPQGGVLSPLLWSLVMDELLQELNDNGFEVIGYADDVAVMVRGWDDSTISSRMQAALNSISDWCARVELNVNPSKTVMIPFTRRKIIRLNPIQLNGITMEMSNETKYLGIILDRELKWTSHIQEKVRIASMSFMACKGLMGKKWGLKPKMIKYIYTAIIKPSITYGAFVWWPRVNVKSACKELAKVQRLASLCITGAMRSTPSVALDVLLNLPPLQFQIEKEAMNTAWKVQQVEKYKPGDFTGHLSILERMSGFCDLNLISDVIPKTYNFEKPFETVYPSREDWITGRVTMGNDVIAYYTDGSRKDGRVGLGVSGPSCRFRKSLGSSPNIFQAEVHAIELCARLCLRRGDLSRQHIYIISDSQAALQALESFVITSALVLDCLQILKELAKRHKVTLMWVPGHEGIEGNEQADELAKKGAEGHFTGPEPFCGYSHSHFKTLFRHWEERKMIQHWQTLPIGSHSRDFIHCSKKRSEMILQLNKKDLKTLVGLLTGHCGLRNHMYNIGKSETRTCRLCLEEDETARHVLCDCVAIATLRLRHFGEGFPKAHTLSEVDPRGIIQFFEELDDLKG